MHLSDILQTIPMFSCFNQNELSVLEKAFSVDTYSDGHQFIKEGARNHTMYLVIDGEVIVTRNRFAEAGYDLIKKLGPGQIFGLISLIDQGRCTASCRAAGAVKAASLPREAFDLLMHTNAAIARHFQTVIVRQLNQDTQVSNEELADLLESGNTKHIRRIAETRSED